MSNKDLADLQLESLARLPFAELQQQRVSAVLLALGSNYQADYHLPYVRESLAKLGEITLSTAFENPDITATKEQPKPDYTNQSIYLALSKSMTLDQLQQTFKRLEEECGRQRLIKTKAAVKQVTFEPVTMDIDILVVKLEDKQNSLSNINGKWNVIAKRYPFATYEMAGIEEIQKKS